MAVLSGSGLQAPVAYRSYDQAGSRALLQGSDGTLQFFVAEGEVDVALAGQAVSQPGRAQFAQDDLDIHRGQAAWYEADQLSVDSGQRGPARHQVQVVKSLSPTDDFQEDFCVEGHGDSVLSRLYYSRNPPVMTSRPRPP